MVMEKWVRPRGMWVQLLALPLGSHLALGISFSHPVAELSRCNLGVGILPCLVGVVCASRHEPALTLGVHHALNESPDLGQAP